MFYWKFWKKFTWQPLMSMEQKLQACYIYWRNFKHSLGWKLSLISAAEQLSLSLQKQNIAIQDALSAVEAAKKHFKHLRSDGVFNGFYEKALRFAEEKGIEQPLLPRNRRRPQRHNTGSEPHHFSSVKEYYRKACDLLPGELQHLFQTKEIPFVVSMEQALIKAANKVDFQSELGKNGVMHQRWFRCLNWTHSCHFFMKLSRKPHQM